mmetsp:Transcript_82028/g.198894  ORF Transcript_82028/g.198894 Transcript_82028/m.198894 type:complete len:103 (-) Transcript_82028:104-412(-)
MIEDPVGSSEHNYTKQSRRKETSNPVFNVRVRKIISRADNAAFIDAPIKFHHNLPGSVIIDVFKLVNVTMLLHDLKKFDDHFRDGPHQYLALASLLGVVHCL